MAPQSRLASFENPLLKPASGGCLLPASITEAGEDFRKAFGGQEINWVTRSICGYRVSISLKYRFLILPELIRVAVSGKRVAFDQCIADVGVVPHDEFSRNMLLRVSKLTKPTLAHPITIPVGLEFAKRWGFYDELSRVAEMVARTERRFELMLRCGLCVFPLLVDVLGAGQFVLNHCKSLVSHGGVEQKAPAAERNKIGAEKLCGGRAFFANGFPGTYFANVFPGTVFANGFPGTFFPNGFPGTFIANGLPGTFLANGFPDTFFANGFANTFSSERHPSPPPHTVLRDWLLAMASPSDHTTKGRMERSDNTLVHTVASFLPDDTTTVPLPTLLESLPVFYKPAFSTLPVAMLVEDLELAQEELGELGIQVVDSYTTTLHPPYSTSNYLWSHRRHVKLYWNKMMRLGDDIPWLGCRVSKFMEGAREQSFAFKKLRQAIGIDESKEHPHIPHRGTLSQDRLRVPFAIQDIGNYCKSGPATDYYGRVIPVSHVSKLLYQSCRFQLPTPSTKPGTPAVFGANMFKRALKLDTRTAVAIVCSSLARFGKDIASAVPLKIVEPPPTAPQISIPSRTIRHRKGTPQELIEILDSYPRLGRTTVDTHRS
ncbi:hypothetical protein K491DRAFT_673195 [Lophiostoma macrostomum CBS 122681]|uniref:Uncharacterized protein n=1 Tax=Lophiostoma macrostomum CBS 122681 TaxID=1314788 RepID=A0A6A6TRL9_9PLEO|nr:hypothetical protein K491DRAFT_673195 [Lophiostoma macrostomum CBS 122681]